MNEKRLILVIEDEHAISNFICRALAAIFYKAIPASSGKEGLSLFFSHSPDLVLLDLGLPDMDGLEVLEQLSDLPREVPVIIISARDRESEKVRALDMGADDYVVKPFGVSELLARIRAMLRRREEFSPDILRCKDLSLNTASYELSCPTGSVVLPRLEYQLMELLIRNQGIYLSSADLLVKIWGYDTDAELGVVWVYISYLRKRLTAVGSSCAIRAKRNVGYTLEAKA